MMGSPLFSPIWTTLAQAVPVSLYPQLIPAVCPILSVGHTTEKCSSSPRKNLSSWSVSSAMPRLSDGAFV